MNFGGIDVAAKSTWEHRANTLEEQPNKYYKTMENRLNENLQAAHINTFTHNNIIPNGKKNI